MDRLLVRAILVVGVLLALAVVAGAARRALDMPAVTPATAAGVLWLMGCAAVFGWLVLVVLSTYRDRGAGS